MLQWASTKPRPTALSQSFSRLRQSFSDGARSKVIRAG